MCVIATLSSTAPEGAGIAGGAISIASYLGFSALVIALLLGGAFVLHRCLRGGWTMRAAKRSLRVVDLLPLGGKRQLAVVAVYDRTLVLGLGEGGVRLLCEWDADTGPLPTGPAPRDDEAPPPAPRAPRAVKARAVLEALRNAGSPNERASADPFEAALASALGGDDADAITPAKPRAAQRAPAKPKARAAEGATKGAQDTPPRRARTADREVPQRAPTVREMLDTEGWVG